MRKSKKLTKSLNTRVGILVIAGFAVFIATGFMLNNNLNSNDASAAYQTCVGYGKSATLKSFTYSVKGASINVTANANGRGDFTFRTVTPNLQCTKVSGRITCALKSAPSKPIFYANYGNNVIKKCVNFTVK